MAKYSRKRTKNVRSNRRSRKVSRKNYSRKRRITKKNKRRISKKRTLRGGMNFFEKRKLNKKFNKEIEEIFEIYNYLFLEGEYKYRNIASYINVKSQINKKIDENNLSVNDLNKENKEKLEKLETIISIKEDEQKKLEEEAKIK